MCKKVLKKFENLYFSRISAKDFCLVSETFSVITKDLFPQIFTIDDDSNEPTMPCGFGRQLPIVPPSLNDLNLPPNPFNILNTMAIVTQTRDNNEQYSPESPEPSCHRPSQHHP